MIAVPAARAFATLLVCVAMLGGCATPQVAALLSGESRGLPARAEIASVPFFPQTEYQCGPAALATVLVHDGAEVTPERLAGAVYVPGREGSLQAEMLAAARREGRLAYVLAPRLDAVLQEVASGTPVVVLQNLSFQFAPVWHYAVVVGYDLQREEIYLRSGTTRRLVVTLSNFERTWARSRYWAMVSVSPAHVPATATEAGYVDAAVALERSSAAGARRAYAAALERWPGNFTATMGAGNTAYAMGALEAAEQAYRRAVSQQPDAADAWNNLAYVLLKRGRVAEARTAVDRALALGGPRRATYEATLHAIELKAGRGALLSGAK